MLVEDEAVGCTVELLIRERTGFLVVNLVDSILDCLPMLLGLRSLHVCITHFVPVNQELVSWQS